MRFFNPAKLTIQQAGHWHHAMAEYSRIIEENAMARYSAMTPEQRRFYLNNMSMAHAHAGMGELQRFIEIEKRRKNSPGDRRSALFARLLNGQRALPVEPPTSYSEPWYDLIEQEGPFPVSIGAVYDEPQGWNFPYDLNGPNILLNQCPWSIQTMNAPARRLLRLQDRIRPAGKSLIEKAAFWKKTNSPVLESYAWPGNLYREVEAEIAAGPEMVVSFGRNKPFLLKIDRTTVFHLRRKARELLSGVGRQEKLSDISCVFNINELYMRAEIGPTIAPVWPKPADDAKEADGDMVQFHYCAWFLHSKI